jgi:hypothetical protein
MATRHTEHEAEEMTREAARKAGDQTTRATRAMSDATERALRSGAEAAERNSDRLLGSWRSGSDAANRIAERSLEQMTKMFGFSGDTATQALQRSSGNLQALLETSSILADGLQDLSGELTKFVQGRAEHNIALMNKALSCRGPHEWVALQTQLVRDHLEALLQTAKKTSERTTRMVDQAVQKMSDSPLAPE